MTAAETGGRSRGTLGFSLTADDSEERQLPIGESGNYPPAIDSKPSRRRQGRASGSDDSTAGYVPSSASPVSSRELRQWTQPWIRPSLSPNTRANVGDTIASQFEQCGISSFLLGIWYQATLSNRGTYGVRTGTDHLRFQGWTRQLRVLRSLAPLAETATVVPFAGTPTATLRAHDEPSGPRRSETPAQQNSLE